jgi:hypothetical protein
VNVPVVQEPADEPLPVFLVTDVQVTLTAEVATVAQPVKAVETVPTFRVHAVPLEPPVTFHVTVAVELPAILLPGLFAANVIVPGVAVMLDTVPVAHSIPAAKKIIAVAGRIRTFRILTSPDLKSRYFCS